MSTVVTVNDSMQQGYTYLRTAPIGKQFDPEFTPDLTPPEMLELGIFGGKYMTDCRDEFPASWFTHAKLSPERHDPSLNYFQVDASQPLSVWQKRAGYIRMILVAGSNGTADTTWAVDYQRKTLAK